MTSFIYARYTPEELVEIESQIQAYLSLDKDYDAEEFEFEESEFIDEWE